MQKFDFFQHHKNVLIKNVQVYQKQSPFLNVWARGPKLGFFHRTTVHHAYYYCGLGHLIVITGGNSQSLTILRHFPSSPACVPPLPPLLPSLVSVSFLTFVLLIAIITMKIETTIDEKNKGRIHLSFYWFSFFSSERSWFRHKNYSLFQTLNLFVGDPRFRNASWYWLLNNNSNLKLKILV